MSFQSLRDGTPLKYINEDSAGGGSGSLTTEGPRVMYNDFNTEIVGVIPASLSIPSNVVNTQTPVAQQVFVDVPGNAFVFNHTGTIDVQVDVDARVPAYGAGATIPMTAIILQNGVQGFGRSLPFVAPGSSEIASWHGSWIQTGVANGDEIEVRFISGDVVGTSTLSEINVRMTQVP